MPWSTFWTLVLQGLIALVIFAVPLAFVLGFTAVAILTALINALSARFQKLADAYRASQGTQVMKSKDPRV